MTDVFRSLLHPIDPNVFREQFYGSNPLLIRGYPTKFSGLFTWDDLNRLLNASPFPHPTLRVSTREKGSSEPATPQALLEHCRAGATMIVNTIHLFDQKIGCFARALEAETGEPMNVNLYLSQPTQSAFGRHYDIHDVFVIQIYGRKAWSVYGRTIEKPLFDMKEHSYDAPATPLIECELEPGDVLYIPRGNWHEAQAQDGMSLHLTLGVDARTGIDFLTWLVDELRDDVAFRDELPLSFEDEPLDVRRQRFHAHVAKLATAVAKRLSNDDLAHRFMKFCVASDRDYVRFKLPGQLLSASTSQLDVTAFVRSPHQRYVLEEQTTDNKLQLSVWGRVIRFPLDTRSLLTFVLSRTKFSLDDAVNNARPLTDQDVRPVLDTLLREGIVEPEPCIKSALSSTTLSSA